jgi:hypothetical protein
MCRRRGNATVAVAFVFGTAVLISEALDDDVAGQRMSKATPSDLKPIPLPQRAVQEPDDVAFVARGIGLQRGGV